MCTVVVKVLQGQVESQGHAVGVETYSTEGRSILLFFENSDF